MRDHSIHMSHELLGLAETHPTSPRKATFQHRKMVHAPLDRNDIFHTQCTCQSFCHYPFALVLVIVLSLLLLPQALIVLY
jgi:hypothetical protein